MIYSESLLLTFYFLKRTLYIKRSKILSKIEKKEKSTFSPLLQNNERNESLESFDLINLFDKHSKIDRSYFTAKIPPPVTTYSENSRIL